MTLPQSISLYTIHTHQIVRLRDNKHGSSTGKKIKNLSARKRTISGQQANIHTKSYLGVELSNTETNIQKAGHYQTTANKMKRRSGQSSKINVYKCEYLLDIDTANTKQI